jgi:hypothetical protein
MSSYHVKDVSLRLRPMCISIKIYFSYEATNGETNSTEDNHSREANSRSDTITDLLNIVHRPTFSVLKK